MGAASPLLYFFTNFRQGPLLCHRTSNAAIRFRQMRALPEGKVETFSLKGGVVEVSKNKVIVLAE